MTEAELIAALPEGRLPPALLVLGGTDLLALFGIGLLLAGLLAIAVRPFLAVRPSLKARIRASRGLPPEERALAVARILGRLPPGLRAVAYEGAVLDDDAIERAALAAARRRR